MKTIKFILALFLFLSGGEVWSQVGVNTNDPKAMLDVNGNLRVRAAEKCEGGSCGDSILVKTNGGYVQTISKDQVLNSGRSYVSGSVSGGTVLLSVVLLSNWLKVSFDQEKIDENNDFNMANSIFTAPRKGIYEVYVQLKGSSLLSAGDFGVGIFVKRGNSSPELIADESYLNVSVLGINVSPPTRNTQTIVALEAGDQMFFGAKTSLLSLELLGSGSSFFSIYQIK